MTSLYDNNINHQHRIITNKEQQNLRDRTTVCVQSYNSLTDSSRTNKENNNNNNNNMNNKNRNIHLNQDHDSNASNVNDNYNNEENDIDNDFETHRLLDERLESFVSDATTSTVGTIMSQSRQHHNQQQQDQQQNNLNQHQNNSSSTSIQSSESIIIIGSVANLCSATLGAGVLALPYAIYQSGIIMGILLLILSAIATICSIDLISCACYVYGTQSYESLTDIILGKYYRRAVECCIIVFTIGCSVAYVIAIGDILEKSHMILIANSRTMTVCVIWFCFLMPLSMLRTMSNLQFASGFGIISIGILVFGSIVHLVKDIQIDIDTNDTSNFFTDISDVLQTCVWPTNGLISIITTCPIILFAFSCQCNVCAIFTELPNTIQSSNNKKNTISTSTETPNNNGSNYTDNPTTTTYQQQQLLDDNIAGNSYTLQSQSSTNTTTGSESIPDSLDTIPTSNITVSASQVTLHTVPSSTTIIEEVPSVLQQGQQQQQQQSDNNNNTVLVVVMKTKDQLMHNVTVWAVVVCTSLYMMVSFVTISDFGSETKPNMLSSYRPVGIMQIAMSAMALAVIMAFPLNIFPARVTLIGLYHDIYTSNDTEPDNTITNDQDNNNTYADTDITSTTTTTEFVDMTSVTDSLAIMNTNNNNNNNNNELENFFNTENRNDNLVVDNGNGSSNDYSINNTSTNNTNNNNSNTNNNTGGMKDVDDPGLDVLTVSWSCHVILTLVMTSITLCIALVLPNISVVFGLLGGTTSSFLGFCVPGLFGLQLSRDLYPATATTTTTTTTTTSNIEYNNNIILIQNNNMASSFARSTTTVGICSSKRTLENVSWTLLIGGIFVGVVSTAVTFYETILRR